MRHYRDGRVFTSELTRYFYKHAMIKPMHSPNAHVVLIDCDPATRQLISDQALIPSGYRVDIFESATQLIQAAGNLNPVVIITDVNLPELSAGDLLIALASLGSTSAVIVIANKGQEGEILQAIRLGAVDFLVRPIREAEVINVIEKVIKHQQFKDQVDFYSKELDESRAALVKQSSDFSEIYSLTRYAFTTPDQKQFSEKFTQLAIQLTSADCAWLLALDTTLSTFSLQSCQNVPDTMQSNITLLDEDELSSLASASGQVIAVHGEGLSRFQTYASLGSAMVAPLFWNEKVSGTITVARNAAQPFTNIQRAMLELASQYYALCVENASRYQQFDTTLARLQHASLYTTLEANVRSDLLRQSSLEIRSPLKILLENVDYLADKIPEENLELTAAINNIQDEAEILMDIADSMINTRQPEVPRLDQIDLNEVVRNTVNRFRPIAQLGKITITLELQDEPAFVRVYPSQMIKAIEGLLSNALKYSPSNGEVSIHIEGKEGSIILSITDQGVGIDESWADGLFEIKSSLYSYSAKRFGGIGISLPTIKEIISAYKGRIWIEPMQGKGFKIAFSLPCQ